MGLTVLVILIYRMRSPGKALPLSNTPFLMFRQLIRSRHWIIWLGLRRSQEHRRRKWLKGSLETITVLIVAILLAYLIHKPLASAFWFHLRSDLHCQYSLSICIQRIAINVTTINIPFTTAIIHCFPQPQPRHHHQQQQEQQPLSGSAYQISTITIIITPTYSS